VQVLPGAEAVLLHRLGDIATSFLKLSLFVSTVSLLPARLLSRLRNVGRALGKVLPLLLLFVDDFFIVRYVTWIGHGSM
jgi:hypothetical protein